MANIIKMPRLSDTMEEGKVEVWHKKLGDKVSEGDVLAEIQTDKAVQDFESEYDGVLLHVGVPQGETAQVDSILAIIGKSGEDISALLKEGNSSAPAQKNETPAEPTVVAASSSQDVPAGVNIINMPRLSDTMEEGTVVKWHKNEGDNVSEGNVLAEIETDKAVQEFESEFDGVLLKKGAEEGKPAKVDTVLAIVGPKGTDVSGIALGVAVAPKQNTTQESTVAKPQETKKSESSSVSSGRVFISPLAKKLAEEKGIDVHSVQGSGENGRIVKRDIENYQPKSAVVASSGTAPAAAKLYVPTGEDQVIEHSQMRKVIAKRLAESKFTAPHYYLTIEVDMENAMQARTSINQIPDTKISFNDIVVKAVAMALRKHPQVNSTWKDNEMIWHGAINLGVAVAVEDGLVVPVVKNTDQKSLSEISNEVRDKAKRARDKKIKADEMEGSTFTVSNLGAYGIESFTSIINQPNSCILSVGAIVEKPVVKNGQIVVGHTMKLTLACDHRTVDGATGSLYLQTLKQYLETPMAMFL